MQKESSFDFHHTLLTNEQELIDIIESIPKDTPVCFDCETDGLDIRHSNMVGFSFCFDSKHGYYIPILHKNPDSALESQTLVDNQISKDGAKKAIEKIFMHDIIGHNIKFDIGIVLHNFGIVPSKDCMDSMILAWLINPSDSLKLDYFMMRYFNHKMIALNDIVPKNSNFSYVDLQTACTYATEDAVATMRLYNKLCEIAGTDILQIASNIEFPFIKTLSAMENSGIGVSIEYFASLRVEFQEKLLLLQKEVHRVSGYEFNVNSTKQLAEILFDKLGLPTQKKGKTGYSTDEATLKAIEKSHEVIPIILEYREAFKLFSTYVEPMLKLHNQFAESNDTQHTNFRIYTSFSHTGTNTGRLSSKSPNLQNVPVRSELGKSIRGGFIANPGYMLVSLDYSQIELRLLAHFSKDSVLLDSFANNIDIHAKTANIIFKKELNDVDSSHSTYQYFRNIAKSINFGLIYGMGPRKLSQTLGITQKEANKYIKEYFANFPSVKDFLERQKYDILHNGYTQTLIGRRRYFDFDGVNDFVLQGYLREGINSIFQGSAADLIKLSMNAIFDRIPSIQRFGGTKDDITIRMLLQIHDELIFEIQEHEANSLAEEIKDIMENIYKLNVPLVCNISKGYTWADLK